MHYDVFNGDADGIIALIQLRLCEPKKSVLVTGVKRDIALLDKVTSIDGVTSITVLDVSMEKNIDALKRLLKKRIQVFYCDHHRSGDVPVSEYLQDIISLDSETCTSLLINDYLNGKYLLWALAAACGDNLVSTARTIARDNNIEHNDFEFLRELGVLINYNGYGTDIKDLHIPPAVLFEKLLQYSCPLSLKTDTQSPYYYLKESYDTDYSYLQGVHALIDTEKYRVFELPNEPWARRMSGVFSNEIANLEPSKAHAVLILSEDETHYMVSVRAPLNNRSGADIVCSQFLTGGGRKAAAGINVLPLHEKNKFIEVFNKQYG